MQSLVLEQCDAFALSQRKRCQCNAYRAPGSPIAAFGVESVIDELAAELDIDPIEFEPFSLAELASKAALTGGPIAVQTSVNAQGPGPAFATHICDVEVDEETGRVDITRYTAVQDAGRAIHPDYVEGQMQGGVAQGIGWALNEEYIYDEDGHLENPGFLDYRIPVASDLPMIDTIVVEVPNDAHPHGVRGAGEVPIVPPMAAVANAIHDATGLRLGELPMSPPKVLAALAAKGETRTPELTASVNPQDRWPRASDGAFAAHIDCASRGTM